MTLKYFINLRYYLIKVAQAWNVTQRKTLERRMPNKHKKSFRAATQISVFICFFCSNTPNKQKTNRKNNWTAGKHYFIKMMFLRSWLIPFEGILKTYFFTDIFTPFVKILKALFWDFPMAVFEKTFMLFLTTNVYLLQILKLNILKPSNQNRTEGTSWKPGVYLTSFPTFTKRKKINQTIIWHIKWIL